MFSDMFVCQSVQLGGGGRGVPAVYKQLHQATTISWCLDSKQVTSSPLWDRSHGTPQEDHRRTTEGSPPQKEHLGRTAAGRTWECRPGYHPPTPLLEEPQLASRRFALEKRLSCFIYIFGNLPNLAANSNRKTSIYISFLLSN